MTAIDALALAFAHGRAARAANVAMRSANQGRRWSRETVERLMREAELIGAYAQQKCLHCCELPGRGAALDLVARFRDVDLALRRESGRTLADEVQRFERDEYWTREIERAVALGSSEAACR